MKLFLTVLVIFTASSWARILPTSSENDRVNQDKQRSIHWFRKDLRLHDNPALLAALTNGEKFYPVYILSEPENLSSGQSRKYNFLLQSLRDLDNSLKEIGSRLIVLKEDKPVADIFADVFVQWNISRLTFEVDTEPRGKVRDEEVLRVARQHQVEVVQRVSHTLYDVERIINGNDGKVPLSFEKFQNVLTTLGLPPQPVDHVTRESMRGITTPEVSNDVRIPENYELLQEFPGGEKKGLLKMQKMLENREWICEFNKSSSSPNSVLPSTSALSPYLSFGCLSPRRLYHELNNIYKQCRNVNAHRNRQEPNSLISQLVWRDMFYTIAAKTENFTEMEQNPSCKIVPWSQNEDHFNSWMQGKTGYPTVDAIMTQLRQEGWIHHSSRQAVACFLTRTDMWISWKRGVEAFDSLLLDSDWSLNVGNWLWLTAQSNFDQYCRKFNPLEFGQETDPMGIFIKKYLPDLRDMPAEYIYQPWNAPLEDQWQTNYPSRIIDHNEYYRRNVQRMEEQTNGVCNPFDIPNKEVSAYEGKKHRTIHWFRSQLRLHDNPSLLAALRNSEEIYPIFVLDPSFANADTFRANKERFFLQSLQDLDNNLKKLNSRLFVIKGKPDQIIPDMIKKWNITRLSHDMPKARMAEYQSQLDRDIAFRAKEFNVEIINHDSHTLYSSKKIVEANGGKVPKTFDRLFNAISKIGLPNRPVQNITLQQMEGIKTPITSDHDERYGVPTLREFSVDPTEAGPEIYPGGETAAFQRLQHVLQNKCWLCEFNKIRSSPFSLEPSTSALSPYLSYGCLSPRTFYYELLNAYQNCSQKVQDQFHTQNSLIGQLLWRELFITVAQEIPNFGDELIRSDVIHMTEDQLTERRLREYDWAKAVTGYPIIDAIMGQLRKEGWIHDSARKIVSCFYAKEIRGGFKHASETFEKYLIDYDYNLWLGNWMYWVKPNSFFSETCDNIDYTTVGKEFDPTGRYIRTYIPALSRLPSEYINEPWRAPSRVHEQSGFAMCRDYPWPIGHENTCGEKPNETKPKQPKIQVEENNEASYEIEPF